MHLQYYSMTLFTEFTRQPPPPPKIIRPQAYYIDRCKIIKQQWYYIFWHINYASIYNYVADTKYNLCLGTAYDVKYSSVKKSSSQ